MNLSHVYLVQILFIGALSIGSKRILEDKYKWFNIARFTLYLLTIKSVPNIYKLIHSHHTYGIDWPKLLEASARYIIAYSVSIATVLWYDKSVLIEDFVYVFVAFLIVSVFEMGTKPVISYGVGMACSFFEGYLVHVIPSDGARFVGFEENMRAFEEQQGVLFPVKKLFIIVTKSLYCPPDLKEFNKSTDDMPYLESMGSLEDVIKNVAGVRGRQYRNTAYKIYRPSPSPSPSPCPSPSPSPCPSPGVCLAAECATPLHTLHRVLTNKHLYDELTDIDVSTVVQDFTNTLKKIIEKSPQCRGKCDIVYYDNEDPTQNLADILLERIRHFEPKFEDKIEARRLQNIVNQPTDEKLQGANNE